MNRPTRPRRRSGITELRVKNFRSVADAVLELGPITVLVGPNASGKSNLLDALRFVSDAHRRDLDYALMTRHGIDAVVCRQSAAQHQDIEIGLEVTSSRYSIDYNFAIARGSDSGTVVKREWGQVRPLDGRNDPVDIQIEEGNIIAPGFLADNLDHLPGYDSHFDPTDLAFRHLTGAIRQSWWHDHAPELGKSLSDGLRDLDRMLRPMRFYRIFPNTVRAPRRPLNLYPLAQDGSNLASVLRTILNNDEVTKFRLIESLSVLIPDVSDLRVESVGGFLVTELKHGSAPHDGSDGWFDLAQESDGTIRLLGLLVSLYQRRPAVEPHRYPAMGMYEAPTLIGIEEPELAVHPGALAALADVLQEASRRSQILVTTHSPDLIDRLSTDQLRVVKLVKGVTEIGPVLQTQAEAVRQNLFSPGELHRMEGLEPDFGN